MNHEIKHRIRKFILLLLILGPSGFSETNQKEDQNSEPSLYESGEITELQQLYNEGLRLSLRGRNKEALEAFDEYLNKVKSPKNPHIYMLRATTKKSLGDIEGAITEFSIAIDQFPSSASLYSRRAELRKISGDTAGASSDVRKVHEIQKALNQERIRRISYEIDSSGTPSLELLVVRSDLWTKVGDPQQALKDIESALKSFPESALLERRRRKLVTILKVNSQKEDNFTADTQTTSKIEINPSNPRAPNRVERAIQEPTSKNARKPKKSKGILIFLAINLCVIAFVTLRVLQRKSAAASS